LISSFFTLEFVGFFDPLSLLHRTFILVVFQRINLFVLGTFILILLLGFLERRFWCNNLCPLGALFSLATRLNFFKKRKLVPLNLSRRYFLGSIGLGLVSILFLRLTPFRKKDLRLIRPPGALPEDKFSALCIRCGECIKICPSKGLEPTFLEAGIEGFWTPRLVPRKGECVQHCVSCGQVCPTGAIQKLTLPEKFRLKIGRAVIDRKRCLSWREEKLCLVCMEFCPYEAIKSENNKPFVIEDECRGCGLCEKVCPVEGESAIIVYKL
jgi:ferredoxin